MACRMLGGGASDLLPLVGDRRSRPGGSAADAASSARSRERDGRARRAARTALRRLLARRGLRDAARRGALPLLGAHDVPHSRGELARCASGATSSSPRPTRAPSCSPTRPNELWSWDITKLLGPAKWTYFYLYVILDVFSRYVVGWMVAHRGERARSPRSSSPKRAQPGHRARAAHLHADRGSSMTSKSVALLLADLGVTKTTRDRTSRTTIRSPRRHFKTLKYRPRLPRALRAHRGRRAPLPPFFDWYNHEHRHGGIGLLTPPTSTTASPKRSTPNASSSSPPPTPRIPSGSSTARHTHRATSRRLDQQTD